MFAPETIVCSSANHKIQNQIQNQYRNENQNQNDVPDDLLVQILLKLPPKSLIRFKTISKSWRTLIDSLSDLYSHSHFTTTASRRHLIHLNDSGPTGPALSAAFLTADHVEDLSGPPPPSLCRSQRRLEQIFCTSLWGPVSGVYCIRIKPERFGLGNLIFWNPTIRQSHVLHPIPVLSDIIDYKGLLCGFGFDPTANDFKVIGITNYGEWFGTYDHFITFHLYSLATNSWKQLNPDPIETDPEHGLYFIPSQSSWDGFYFNGACHWLFLSGVDFTEGVRTIMTMLSFDFGSEKFRVFWVPSIINVEFVTRVMSIDDCLALVCSVKLELEPCRFDVYVMTEYGVEDSWIKAYTVVLRSSYGQFLGIVGNEFFVRETDAGPIVSYCLSSFEPKQEGHVHCPVNCCSFRILPYHESLVPVKPSKVKKKKNKKRKMKKMYTTWCGDEGILPDTIVLVAGSWENNSGGIACIVKDRNTGEDLGVLNDRCETETETAGQMDALATLIALKWCIAMGRRSVVIWTDSLILWQSLANNGMGERAISGIVSEILYYGKELYCGRIKKVRHADVVRAYRIAISTRTGEMYP